jgi:uncharacterized protein YdiU (UPF0061 family)
MKSSMGRIGLQRSTKVHTKSRAEVYPTFHKLDGRHDWQTKVPDASVLYSARRLNYGKVLYFNFDLAKEMGLIAVSHPHVMNADLEKTLLHTFNLRIINEYDLKTNVHYHPSVMCKNKYMATRYLQLQHTDKTGRTSGDGRSIWNGQVTHNGTVWDVSSRGTGVTCLAPGSVEAGKPLKSGSGQFGYGCGTADLDELVGTALMAEPFHQAGIPTERVLLIIDSLDGNGIGVRAGKNLFRPAHVFPFLKQSRRTELCQALDFLIDREYKNKNWNFKSSDSQRFNLMLGKIVENFADFVARLERDYIFAWLDWDGDNVLFTSGIIDYGSIRQFGLRHDEYRYDDVERFSTNLNEQRKKAAMIIQVFAQLVDFANTGKKRPVSRYAHTKWLHLFQRQTEEKLMSYFLQQVGLNDKQVALCRHRHAVLCKALFNSAITLESTKTRTRKKTVADGVNRPAIFNMRKLLSNLPEMWLRQESNRPLARAQFNPAEIHNLILAENCSRTDKKMTRSQKRNIRNFINIYKKLILALAQSKNKTANHLRLRTLLTEMTTQAKAKNRTDRMTGDGLLYVVDKIMRVKNKSKDFKLLQAIMDGFIGQQSPNGKNHGSSFKGKPKVEQTLMTLATLVDQNSETI